ncbi:hypothetical protein CDAR_540021 [Caerostris darwini]|uniref:Uncharacterized protein n=1 Tax=Caerostris darwini TaxID=1538125 RepID=A0AAV4TPW3_9ARAC|nr:hypothetical protein CDAR_540021 [Caerostris darwini]
MKKNLISIFAKNVAQKVEAGTHSCQGLERSDLTKISMPLKKKGPCLSLQESEGRLSSPELEGMTQDSRSKAEVLSSPALEDVLLLHQGLEDQKTTNQATMKPSKP